MSAPNILGGPPSIHCTRKDQEAAWLQNQVQEPSEDHLAAALADISPGLHPKLSSTTINIAESTSEYDEDEAALAVQLEQLKLKRVRLQKQQRCQALRAAIAQEQQYVESMEEQSLKLSSTDDRERRLGAPGVVKQDPNATDPATITTSSLKQAFPGGQYLQTPLDNLLQALPLGRSWQDQTSAHRQDARCMGQPLETNPVRASEMFLRPSKLPHGEKVLKIVDFVDSIVPRDDEHLLSSVRTAKIVVSYGPRKPKLEQITLQHG